MQVAEHGQDLLCSPWSFHIQLLSSCRLMLPGETRGFYPERETSAQTHPGIGQNKANPSSPGCLCSHAWSRV